VPPLHDQAIIPRWDPFVALQNNLVSDKSIIGGFSLLRHISVYLSVIISFPSIFFPYLPSLEYGSILSASASFDAAYRVLVILLHFRPIFWQLHIRSR
jgi:hypothetical protein